VVERYSDIGAGAGRSAGEAVDATWHVVGYDDSACSLAAPQDRPETDTGSVAPPGSRSPTVFR